MPRSWEGTPNGTEVCFGEDLAGPVMGVKTVSCSEARAIFMAFMTAAKRAGSRAEPARDVNTGGTNWNYRVFRHICQQRLNVQGFQSQRRIAKETSSHAVVCLACSSQCKKRKLRK